jgi:hypothetical protein
MMTLKQDFVDEHPSAPVALLKACRQARDVALNGIEGADPAVLTDFVGKRRDGPAARVYGRTLLARLSRR